MKFLTCQLKIKSEPFLVDLKFKSEHLKSRQNFVISAMDGSTISVNQATGSEFVDPIIHQQLSILSQGCYP